VRVAVEYAVLGVLPTPLMCRSVDTAEDRVHGLSVSSWMWQEKNARLAAVVIGDDERQMFNFACRSSTQTTAGVGHLRPKILRKD